jgi:VWFA-related protein
MLLLSPGYSQCVAQSRMPPPPPRADAARTLREVIPSQETDEVISVTTTEVLLPATVRDASGRIVPNLTAQSFRIFEDGREQQLTSLAFHHVPVDVVLMIDTSSSTAESFEDFRRAAEEFAGELAPEDRVSLIKFDDRVELLQDWTRSPVQLRRSLRRITQGMFTRFYDALYLAAKDLFGGERRRRAIVVLTDGVDSGRGSISSAEAARALLKGEATVYVIGSNAIQRARKLADLDSLLSGDSSSVRFNELRIEDLREGLRVLDASENALKELTAATGGRLYTPSGFSELGKVYGEIAEELRNQYALYYTPQNDRRDGGFRRVRVEVVNPSLDVKTRVGYFPPRG